MLEQISMFENPRPWPQSFKEFETVVSLYLDEGELGEDRFIPKETKKGRSYFIFGKKMVEMSLPSSGHPATFRIPFDENSNKFKPVEKDLSFDDFLKWLSAQKRAIYKDLCPEVFGCCDSFIQCSDAGHCLYSNDRFFNGCIYRKNLEAGRIFYGKNQTD